MFYKPTGPFNNPVIIGIGNDSGTCFNDLNPLCFRAYDNARLTKEIGFFLNSARIRNNHPGIFLQGNHIEKGNRRHDPDQRTGGYLLIQRRVQILFQQPSCSGMQWQCDAQVMRCADGVQRIENPGKPFRDVGVVVAVDGGQEVVIPGQVSFFQNRGFLLRYFSKIETVIEHDIPAMKDARVIAGIWLLILIIKSFPLEIVKSRCGWRKQQG